MAKPTEEYTWRDLNIGCVIDEPGSASQYKTGDWRTGIKPEWNEARCIKCGLCWLFCPEAAIYQKADGFFVADFDYCKGCGICARECWPKAIAMVEETR